MHYQRAYFFGENSNYIFGYPGLNHRFWWRTRLRLVRRLRPCGRLLDVGCAFGFFLKLLGPAYETYGMDLSDYAVEEARRVLQSRERVRKADLEQEIPFSGIFDLITVFDLIEHLERPVVALKHLSEALHPDGFLVLEFPTRGSLIDRDACHLYRSIQEWQKLLEQAGLRVVELKGYWTAGLRLLMFPVKRRANYYRIVARPKV